MELLVVTAGAGNPSSCSLLGERLATATQAALADSACTAETTHLALHTLGTDLIEALIARRTSPALAAARQAVLSADGVIAVTPVYNGSYSGLFKLFFDALDPRSLVGRPVLLGATGGSPRHSLVVEHSLLPMFYYFKAEVAPLAVFAAPGDWQAGGSELEFRIQRAAQAFAHRMVDSQPAKQLPSQPVLDYDDLLRG